MFARITRTAGVLAVLFIFTPAFTAIAAAAVDFSGTYITDGQDVVLNLVLEQDAQGKITGTLSSTSGGRFQVDGQLQGDTSAGICYNDQGGSFFQSSFSGTQIVFTLIEPDEYNQPDYSRVQQLVFTRQGQSAKAPSWSGESPAGSQPPKKEQKGHAGLTGSWKCQATDGPKTIVFQSGDVMVLNGQSIKYTVHPGNILRIYVGDATDDYRFSRSGDELTMSYSDGWQMQCRPGSAADPDSGQTAGSGYEHMLQGLLCSWSGSSSSYSVSSYSSSDRMHFDGQGNFSSRYESSFSGDAGMAYGGNPAEGGTYRVSNSGISLRYRDGSTATASVAEVNNDVISGIKIGKTFFAKGLCD